MNNNETWPTMTDAENAIGDAERDGVAIALAILVLAREVRALRDALTDRARADDALISIARELRRFNDARDAEYDAQILRARNDG